MAQAIMSINCKEFQEWLSTIGKDLNKKDVEEFIYLLKDDEVMDEVMCSKW